MINSQLTNLAVPLEHLKPDPENAREHSQMSITAIMAALSSFGQQKPIVANSDGIVIAGNGMFEAAKQLGWKEIAAVIYDGEGDQTGFAIADNRTAELSRWGYEVLSGKLTELRDTGFDINNLGWQEYELVPMLESRWEPEKETGDDFTIPDSRGCAPVKLTPDQREVIDKAIKNVRANYEKGYTEGRCIELICADYLAGK